MLPLQLNKLGLHKKITVITKLIIVSFVIHCIIAAMFFFISMKRHRLVINNIDLDNADIVLMPFTKHINKKTKVMPQKITQKQEQKTTINEKPVKQQSMQTSLVKKVPAKKQMSSKKQQTAKKKNDSKKKMAPAQKVMQSNNAKKPSRKTEAASNKTQSKSTAVGRHDLDLLQQAQAVKQAIYSSWSRPTGLSKACEYRAVIHVDSNGHATLIKEVPSGALALDMSARNFLVQFSFPKQLAHYEIEIIL